MSKWWHSVVCALAHSWRFWRTTNTGVTCGYCTRQVATPTVTPGTARKYGWHPDLPDHRDRAYMVMGWTGQLPPKIDLSTKCSPVENQGTLGSCTANAIAGALEFNEEKNNPAAYVDLSRLFIYYNERMIEGTTGQDAGAQLRDGIKALVRWGVCKEAEWGYDVSKFTIKPPVQCYKDAIHSRISSYHRLIALNDMKTCLSQGFPFVFGFTVYESFESTQMAKTGVLSLPGVNEQPLGGHAVLAVGYDDYSQRILVRNSWGTNWGQKGYFTMPYTYINNPNLARDIWTIRK